MTTVQENADQSRLPPPGDADFRLMVDAIADYAIFLLDPAGRVRSWNKGARLLKGYAEEEIVGQHFSRFYPAEALERQWPEHELQVALEEGRFEDEGWRLRKDGSRFWASVIITRLLDADGTLRGYSKVTRDLTERRRHEEELRLSEERFRLLVEGVKDYAIFMLDPAGFIVSWNTGARLNTGYEAAEVIGQHFSIFYPDEIAASDWPAQELHEALTSGRYEEEGWRVRKDGSRFWASVVLTALRDASGQHRGFAKVTQDLTDRRRVTLLEEEGRRLTAFMAMLAHELRNPLAPISNAVAILDMQENLPEPARMARGIISRQQKQLTRLVDDLLDISRITSGKIHLDARPVELSDVISAAVETVEPLLRDQAHSVAIDNPRGIWVSGDRARLVQIVCNLLHNAAKFTPHGGRISVASGGEGDSARIVVKDNGPGIAAEKLPQLFTRFTQREHDASKTFGGLGLGLSLVHQLTTLQRGSVSASSTGIAGEGAEFVVRLPRIAAPEQTAAPADVCAVVVVDDSRDTADTLTMLLNGMGYPALAAYNGEEALATVKTQKPKVVLMDIGLPDIDGVEVAKRLHSEMAAPPTIIAITGYGMDMDRERSFKAGFYAHLTKPADPARLRTLLKSLLE